MNISRHISSSEIFTTKGVRIQYRNEFQDYLVFHEFLSADFYHRQKSDYYASMWIPATLALLGVAGSFQHSLFITLLILIVFVTYLYGAIPYKKHHDRALAMAAMQSPDRDISLEFKEDGILEEAGGVRSFCPWSSVTNFTVFKDTLLIQLSAYLYAVIPGRYLLDQGLTIDFLTGLLESKGIQAQPSQPAHGGGKAPA